MASSAATATLIVAVPEGSAQPRALAIAPDGGLVLGGCVDTGGPEGVNTVLVRLHGNGTPDAGFGPGGQRVFALGDGGSRTDCAHSVAVQPDGRILVAGHADRGVDDSDWFVARVTAAGALDPTFATAGVRYLGAAVAPEGANVVRLDRLGNVLVGGFTTDTDQVRQGAIVRLLASGSDDPAFGTNGRYELPSAGDVLGLEVVSPSSNRVLYLHATTSGLDELGSLTEKGEVDPTFHGGTPLPLLINGQDASTQGMTLASGFPVVTSTFFAQSLDWNGATLYYMDHIFGDDLGR